MSSSKPVSNLPWGIGGWAYDHVDVPIPPSKKQKQREGISSQQGDPEPESSSTGVGWHTDHVDKPLPPSEKQREAAPSPRDWDDSEDECEWKPAKMTGYDLMPFANQCVDSIHSMRQLTMKQFWTDYGSDKIKEKIRKVLGNLSRGVDNGTVTEARMVNLNETLCSCIRDHRPFSPKVVVDAIFYVLVGGQAPL